MKWREELKHIYLGGRGGFGPSLYYTTSSSFSISSLKVSYPI